MKSTESSFMISFRMHYETCTIVTRSRGTGTMLWKLILSDRIKEVTFLCVTLFLNLKNCLYSCNYMSDWVRVWMKHFTWTSKLYWKMKINITEMWFIPFDRVTIGLLHDIYCLLDLCCMQLVYCIIFIICCISVACY